ncbi:hypothetical protein BDQ17DRAFT_1435111 [Cyathus striatus]|nr:hypothetical protein BDQ17DRAFT_1435111 [Cyathus striatus]
MIPSPQQPTSNEVKQNLEANFGGILDIVQGCIQSGQVLHTVLMFDEIATEGGIHWDPKMNDMLGVCQQHSHRMSVQLVNEDDVKELFRCLDEKEVHYASEATITAIGALCKNNQVYPAWAVMASGDCKHETGEEHAVVLQTVMDSVNTLKDKTKFCIVSIASDGEAQHGSAMIQLTFKKILNETSPIYNQLKFLTFLNLHVGDNDLTCDKDFKHIFKRLHNLIIREHGITIDGHHLTPDIIIRQLKYEGLAADHIQSIFNPDDEQDVKLA